MTVIDEFRPRPDKHMPAALVAAFLLQSAGALFWAGSAAERITQLERTVNGDQAAIEKVAVLEQETRAIKESLDRIEAKLDQPPR